MTTTYKTIVNANYLYEGGDLERAIRVWDSESIRRADISGGVMVTFFNDEGLMVRDGWLLHVSSEGHVYLNPNLKDQ